MATKVPATNGPDLWGHLLRVVGLHWQPLVAGGCIRDLILGLAPKDIDIFVPAHSDEDFYSIIDSLPSTLVEGEIIWLGTKYIETERGNDFCSENAGEYGEDAAAPDLVGVWEGEICGWPVNIIGRESVCEAYTLEPFADRAMRLLDTFDYDYLQAAYTENGYIRTAACRQAIENKVATMTHDRSYDQSIARFRRFDKRNPNLFRLNDPFKDGVRVQ